MFAVLKLIGDVRSPPPLKTRTQVFQPGARDTVCLDVLQDPWEQRSAEVQSTSSKGEVHMGLDEINGVCPKNGVGRYQHYPFTYYQSYTPFQN